MHGWKERSVRRSEENDEGFEVEVTVRHKTEKALLVADEDGEEHWIPFSQIHDDSEIYENSKKGDSGKLVVHEWLAKKIGWCD